MGATLIAAAGLVFTAWNVHYGARVADDQLNQSQEQSEREERRQAAVISFWSEGGNKDGKVVILNRSLDPIYGVRVEFGLLTNSLFDLSEKISIYRQVVQPCTRLEIQIRPVWSWASREEHGKSSWDSYEQSFLHRGLRVNALGFVDAYGVAWVRYPGQFSNDDYSGGASLLRADEATALSTVDVEDGRPQDRSVEAENCSAS